MRCYRKILHISYKDHVTNEEVRAKIQRAIGPHKDRLTIAKRRKLHIARHSERGKKTRQTEEEVGRQHQGMVRPGVRQVEEGGEEQGKMEKTGCKIICGAPTTLAVEGLMMMMMMIALRLVCRLGTGLPHVARYTPSHMFQAAVSRSLTVKGVIVYMRCGSGAVAARKRRGGGDAKNRTHIDIIMNDPRGRRVDFCVCAASWGG